MTIAEGCILVACLLPIACAGIAKSKGFGKPRRDGGFDNNSPRQWLASLQGWQARANAAHILPRSPRLARRMRLGPRAPSLHGVDAKS